MPRAAVSLIRMTSRRCTGHSVISVCNSHNSTFLPPVGCIYIHDIRTFSSTTDSLSDTPSNTLIGEYNQLVRQKNLIFDSEQERVAKKFTQLQGVMGEYDHKLLMVQLKQLEEYKAAELTKKQRENEIDNASSEMDAQIAPPPITVQIPRGIYLYGDVGTGKSLLMNMFYASSSLKKRRLHFHSLLQEIHSRIFELNKQILQSHGRSFHIDTSKDRNPIIQIAQQLSTEVTLLCIDEFQVTDVADAMILSQLFGELWRNGVVVVATSNRPPQDLYEGGLNRSYFLPFIDLLEKYCLVMKLGTHHDSDDTERSIDYRRIKSGIHNGDEKAYGDYYFLTSSNDSAEMLDQLFGDLRTSHSFREKVDTLRGQTIYCQSDSNSEHLELEVKFQRTIIIPRYHTNIIARFTFEELCTTELGSSDYQAVAQNFQIVMIEDIPQLTLKYPDRARRFITLIDELYESGCCLVCSADEIPDHLFVGRVDSSRNRIVDTPGKGDDVAKLIFGIDVAQSQGMAVGELASVKELTFAFRRATSRLLEMCSKTWWMEKGIVLKELR